MGAALQGTDYLIDGINEKGLAVGLFYFPTFASYAQTTRDNQARSVAIVDFGTWLLTNFATLDEVRAAVRHADRQYREDPDRRRCRDPAWSDPL